MPRGSRGQSNGAVKAKPQGEIDSDSPKAGSIYSTPFFFGVPNAGKDLGRSGLKHSNSEGPKAMGEDLSVLSQTQSGAESFDFKHEVESMDVFRARGSVHNSSSGSSVVEGLPQQKRSGEMPRGSSSSSGESPIFNEVTRTVRKSGEISRLSISSSGEIPRASCSSSGEIVDGLRSHRRNGDVPRGSNSSSSSNGESPTVEGLRGTTTNRKSGEVYHANSSGGSSSGGSPTPELFYRSGRKNGEGAHGSNSSGGSSDGGSPSAESLWSGKGGAILNTGMVTGGSFSSFNAVANGTNLESNTAKKAVKEKPTENSKTQNGGSNGIRLNANAAPAPSGRFLVGAASSELRSGIRPSGTSILGAGDVNAFKRSADLKNHEAPGRTMPGISSEEVKNLGNVEYKKGNFAKALSLYDRAIALCPEQAAFRCNRAAALAGLGRLGEAVEESEMAIKLDSSFSRAHQRLVSLNIRLGQIEEATKHLKVMGQQGDLGDLHRAASIEKRLASCSEARKSRDWSSVIKECDGAIVAGADCSLEVLLFKAEALVKLQRLDDADAVLAAARRVEEVSPRSTRLHFGTKLLVLRAQADMAQGRFEEAVAVADKAVRLEPKNFEVSALLRKARTVSKARAAGNEFFKAGKFFEACAAYTEGLELDPASAVLLCNRAASRSKLGQWEKTLEDCNAALQVQPSYMKALLRRAHSYAKLERWEDAARDYEAIRREHPGDVEVAQALFDVQVALKKSRGEEISRTRFGGGVEEVTRNDQFREAISCPGLSVVEFTTRWSDRCRQFSAFVEELCRRYPSVNFSKVDVDDSPYLAQLESISSVPTFKIFRNGVNVKELLGPSQQGLEQAVKQCSGV